MINDSIEFKHAEHAQVNHRFLCDFFSFLLDERDFLLLLDPVAGVTGVDGTNTGATPSPLPLDTTKSAEAKND